MYEINHRFKSGYGGIYDSKYLDEALSEGNLLYALNIAHTNIEILLRYIYLFGIIVQNNQISSEDMEKVDKPTFARLLCFCSSLIGEELYDEIDKFNKIRTKIHTIVVNNQIEEDTDLHIMEINKTKDYCEKLFNVFFAILNNKNSVKE